MFKRGNGITRTGAKNKRSLELMDLLEINFPKWNPILQMASIANDRSQSMELRFAACKEVAQYIAPKKKAVEITEGKTVRIQLLYDYNAGREGHTDAGSNGHIIDMPVVSPMFPSPDDDDA